MCSWSRTGRFYDLAVEATDIIPTGDEAAEILARLEREHTTAENRGGTLLAGSTRFDRVSPSGPVPGAGALCRQRVERGMGGSEIVAFTLRPATNVCSRAICAAKSSGSFWPPDRPCVAERPGPFTRFAQARSVACRGNWAPQDSPARWVVTCRSTFSIAAVRVAWSGCVPNFKASALLTDLNSYIWTNPA